MRCLRRWHVGPSHGRCRLPEPNPRPARPAAVVIPEIDGVDVREGLKRAAGNRRLYRDLLIRFAKDHLDVGTQIAAALESGDPKQAAHIAHTVKGVAGNLSIGKIYSSADKLEKAIRERDSAVPKLLSAFTSVVNASNSRHPARATGRRPRSREK